MKRYSNSHIFTGRPPDWPGALLPPVEEHPRRKQVREKKRARVQHQPYGVDGQGAVNIVLVVVHLGGIVIVNS